MSAQFEHCVFHHHQHPIGEPCPFCVVEGDDLPEGDDDDSRPADETANDKPKNKRSKKH